MQVDARAVVISVARAMTWVREIGPNRGQAVEAILRRVVLPPGSPWCAAFVAWVGRAALDGRWPLPLVGGCATLGEAALARGMIRQAPENGAIFLLWSDRMNRFNHTGFISATAGEACFTVEGNTSPDGSPEGTGVFERTRTFGERDRFVHWWVAP